MKHAYLIIAHNEFDVLKLLISMIDDERSDIYVHIDKKVRNLPELSASKSRLYILDKRVDVRWGHVSQIETELLLFETAHGNGPYSYYHLISGTHLPLKTPEEIYNYFELLNGKNVFLGLSEDSAYQETLKVRSVNLFLRNFSSSNKIVSACCQFLWKVSIRIQRILHVEVNVGCSFRKASNWVHLSEMAVQTLVKNKNLILGKYKYSFCGDEYFVPSELLALGFETSMESRNDVLYVEMGRSNPRTFHVSDLESLRNTGCLFARKFQS